MQRAGVDIKRTEPVLRETCFGGSLGSQSQTVPWFHRSLVCLGRNKGYLRFLSQLQNISDGESSSALVT